jgi:phage repressor protein C with HTH and peptisase S24 domain
MNEETGIGERVRARREALGKSQDWLAEAAGTSQATIDKIEHGRSRRSKFLPNVFAALGLPLEELASVGMAVTSQERNEVQGRLTVPVAPSRDLPVYASAEGGPGGTIFSTDPIEFVSRPDPLANVKDSYAMYVVGDSMSPAFEQGDLILVHPHLPYRTGDDVLIYRIEHGQYEAAVKRLRKATTEQWQLEQFNPAKHFSLPRRQWPTCHVIIGKYSRR